MQRRALITGIAGQDGSYLTELLLGKGNYEVHGIVRCEQASRQILRASCGPINEDNLERLFIHDCDLLNQLATTELVRRIAPDEIYNLAAQSHVGASFDDPRATVDVIALGALHLLDAARQLNRFKDVRYYQASSCEQFGGDPNTVPQSETTSFHPRSPYACAKAYAHYQAVNYREAHGLFVCCGILFNHESPRRRETFVTRKITLAAARIREGLQDKLRLGNLDAMRDWGYAHDYVQAMWLMLQHDEPDDYVVATGETHSVRQFVEAAFDHVGLNYRKFVETDARYLRPCDVELSRGDASKAHARLAWRPATDFHGLVELMVDADVRKARWEQSQTLVAGADSNRLESGENSQRRSA